MAHPFTKLLETALRKSTVHKNLVLKKAQELVGKGYRKEEVCEVLEKLSLGRIDDTYPALSVMEYLGRENRSIPSSGWLVRMESATPGLQ